MPHLGQLHPGERLPRRFLLDPGDGRLRREVPEEPGKALPADWNRREGSRREGHREAQRSPFLSVFVAVVYTHITS